MKKSFVSFPIFFVKTPFLELSKLVPRTLIPPTKTVISGADKFSSCALSISNLDKKIVCVIGKIEGKISPKPKGTNGFGYDPIFIPNGKKITFGEMRPKIKHKIDHRFRAFKKIKRFF